MLLPDGSVLMHANNLPYDPVKAHEYYLRTRKLKGRKHGTSYTVKGRNGKAVRVSAQELEEQKVYAAARVAQLKKNLDDLGVLLRDKMKAAKAAEAKSKKPPTLAEKAKAAREAEAYQKAHKQSIANKAKAADTNKAKTSSSATKTDTVDSLKKEISTTRANLKAAVARQRDLATAKKNG